jgi:hypothetical protein
MLLSRKKLTLHGSSWTSREKRKFITAELYKKNSLTKKNKDLKSKNFGFQKKKKTEELTYNLEMNQSRNV